MTRQFDVDRLEGSINNSILYLNYLRESMPGPGLDEISYHLEEALAWLKGERPDVYTNIDRNAHD
jgi:hypothetical protein